MSQETLTQKIKSIGLNLGFSAVGISGTDVSATATKLQDWLTNGYHANLSYLEKNFTKRQNPTELLSNLKSIIVCALSYNPANNQHIASYALGDDYHFVVKHLLLEFAHKIQELCGPFNYRCFVDSAPVFEKPMACNAGIGWQGKNSIVINPQFGSFFVIGEIYCDLPLEFDKAQPNRCGHCRKCIDQCPTNALQNKDFLDARKCIAYWTIEWKGVIPEEIRPLIGTRIFGCDTCQTVCPWNQKATSIKSNAFLHKKELSTASLLDLFNWTEQEFTEHTKNSAITRVGYECWQRNIAVALGNSPYDPAIISALEKKAQYATDLVRKHLLWAIEKISANRF
jgi:epoxyqueuosine reductase